MDNNRSLMEQAVAAARQRDFASARNLLRQLLRQEPNNLNAWLLAAHVVETRSDAIGCYKQVLRLDPTHVYAKQKLSQLQGESAVPVSPSKDRPETGGDANVFAKQPVPPPPQPDSRQPQAVPRPQVHPSPRKTSASAGRNDMIILGILLGVLCLAALGIVILLPRGLLLKPAAPTPTSQQLFEVLYQNARAANAEDVDAYMATIHPQSSMYRQTKVALQQAFSLYDLEFQFYNLQVTSLKADEAQVHFSLLTRKLQGPAFQNNVLTGTMILRPDRGAWKIYDQKVENVQYQ